MDFHAIYILLILSDEVKDAIDNTFAGGPIQNQNEVCPELSIAIVNPTM